MNDIWGTTPSKYRQKEVHKIIMERGSNPGPPDPIPIPTLYNQLSSHKMVRIKCRNSLKTKILINFETKNDKIWEIFIVVEFCLTKK